MAAVGRDQRRRLPRAAAAAVGRDRWWLKAVTDRGRRPWVSGGGGRRPRSTATEDPLQTRSGREAAATKDDAERPVLCFLARRIFGKQPEFDAPRRRKQRRRLAAAAEGRRPLSTAAEGPSGRAVAAAKKCNRLVRFSTARLQAGRSRLRPRAAPRRRWEIACERGAQSQTEKRGGGAPNPASLFPFQSRATTVN